MDRKLSLLIHFASVDKLSGSLRNIVGLGQTGGQRLGAMKREARELERELRGVRTETSRTTGNVTALINRERDLEDRIGRTNAAMERQVRLLTLERQASTIQQRGQDLRASGTENVITGVAMAAPMVLASKQAMTFESAMADVRKVVDFDSPKQFRQMSEDLLDLSTRIPMTAEGMASIVAAAGRAGVARKELLVFAQDAAQMGIAFDTTAEEAGGMMAKWRTAFGMGQGEVRTLSDQINALTNKYGGNVTAVAAITTRIGALGKVAGVAAPQIAAMGQLMDSVGVGEEIAATGIKNMMLAMTKGTAATKGQKKVFAALGLDAQNVAKAMQDDAGGAITDLLKRIQRLPKETQAGTLTELFGSESVAAIAPLLANLDRLEQNFALVGDKAKYAGSMQKEYLARIATTEGATGLAVNALKAVNITLGTMLLPTITAASKKIVQIANVVRDWAGENPGLAKGLLLTWGAATGLVLGMGALKIGLGLLLGPFSTLFRLVGTNGPMIVRLFGLISSGAMFLGRGVVGAGAMLMRAAPVLVRSFGLLRTAALFLGQGFLRAGMMMLANPIVLIITAVVAAIGLAAYLIYTHWDTIKATFTAGWNWIKSTLAAAPGWLRTIGSAMMQGLLAALNPGILAQRLLAIARTGIAAFKGYFGIKSPSRLFMSMGGFMTEGLARGVDKGADRALRSMRQLATGVTAAATFSAAPSLNPAFANTGEAAQAAQPGTAKRDAVRPAILRTRVAITPVAPTPASGRKAAGERAATSSHSAPLIGSLTINQQPGENAEALAERIAAKLEQKKRNAGRGSYHDA